jgi:hypothetical protein
MYSRQSYGRNSKEVYYSNDLCKHCINIKLTDKQIDAFHEDYYYAVNICLECLLNIPFENKKYRNK